VETEGEGGDFCAERGSIGDVDAVVEDAGLGREDCEVVERRSEREGGTSCDEEEDGAGEVAGVVDDSGGGDSNCARTRGREL
jgi:hypothetical protein